jgi:hypothetical protein
MSDLCDNRYCANFQELCQHEGSIIPLPLAASHMRNVPGFGILSCTHVGDAGVGNGLHVAQRFEHLLDTFRRPDGSRWTGQQLDEATVGVVPRSYFTNLRKGRIESPATRRCWR